MQAPAEISGDRLRAAREACGIRSCQKLVDYLKERGVGRGFSYTKLSRIEAGMTTLAPQDAEFIARHLGLPRSFFTAPLDRLGDVHGNDDALSQRAEAQHALADEALAALDAARRGAPHPSSQEEQRSPRKRTA